MASSKLDVVNQALVRIGASKVASLSDAEAEAVVASQLYDTIVSCALTETIWYFALGGALLAEIDTSAEPYVPFERFDRVFQLPTDVIRVLGLESLGRFRLAGDRLYSNEKAPRLVYVKDVSQTPSLWQPYFTNFVVHELAGAFAISITDTAARAEIYIQQAQVLKRRAMGIDAQQTPPEVYELMRVYLRPTYNPLSGP